MNRVDLNKARALSDNKRETMEVRIPFTEDELIGLNDEFARKSLELKKSEDDFKEIAKDWKEKIKVEKQVADNILTDIKNQYREEERECYLMPVYDANKMQYIDVETGEVRYQRPLLPNENQMNLNSHIHNNNLKEVSNG